VKQIQGHRYKESSPAASARPRVQRVGHVEYAPVGLSSSSRISSVPAVAVYFSVLPPVPVRGASPPASRRNRRYFLLGVLVFLLLRARAGLSGVTMYSCARARERKNEAGNQREYSSR